MASASTKKSQKKDALLRQQEQQFVSPGAEPIGGVDKDELEDRGLRVASAMRSGVALHPGDDEGDGQSRTSGMPLSVFTTDMTSDMQIRSDLRGNDALLMVGENAAEEVALARDNSAVLGMSPEQIRTPKIKPPRSQAMPAPPRAAAVPVPRSAPAIPSLDDLPEDPADLAYPPPRDGKLVEFLLQQNADLRQALAQLAEKVGHKVNFIDKRLADLRHDVPVDEAAIEMMTQIVLVKNTDGTYAHALFIDGQQVAANSFKIEVDTDNGVCNLDVNLRKKLF